MSFDPRFPAAFQRGYEGGAETEMPAADEVGPTPARVRELAAPEPVTHDVDRAVRPDPTDEVELGVNPFVVAAWVLSAGLLVGGVMGAYWAQRMMFGGYTGPQPSEALIASQFILASLAPSAIASGLLGIVGLLLWHAAAWRRRAIAAQRHPEPHA